jgi:hypothetical protein
MSSDRFDELEREHQYKSKLGAEIARFIDDANSPHEYLIEEDEEDEDAIVDLETMGLAPFVQRGDTDDVV